MKLFSKQAGVILGLSALLGLIFAGCGNVPQQNIPTDFHYEVATWRPLSSAEPFAAGKEPRRLVLANEVALQAMSESETDLLTYLFSNHNPTHYAFFIDGKAVTRIAHVPSWTLFCGVTSRKELSSGVLRMSASPASRERLLLTKSATLSFIFGTGWGVTTDEAEQRSLIYKHMRLESIGKENALWSGYFLCGVFSDRVIPVDALKESLERADLLFWGKDKTAKSLLHAVGENLRYEIFAKKPTGSEQSE